MSNNEFIDYFDMLGVSTVADSGEVSGAYRKLAKQYHPDTNHDDNSAERFSALQEAYETLIDSGRRADYVREHKLHYGAVGFIDLKPAVRDLFDDMVEYLKGIGGIRKKDVFELVLDGRFARYDRLIDLDIPLVTECSKCKGIGSIAWYQCDECGGKGSFVDHRSIEIEIPGGVGSGWKTIKELDDQKVIVVLTYR